MINLTATTESNPQTIAVWSVSGYGGTWKLKCVAWISQSTYDSNGNYAPRTVVKYKWQIEQNGYYPYWNDKHTYTLTLAEHSHSVVFSLPQSKVNGTRDMCSAQTLGTYAHNSSGDEIGEYANTFNFKGAYCWSLFDYSEAMMFPKIDPPTPSPEPTPTPIEPDQPTPLVFNSDPHYYIYADGQLVYGAGIKGYEVLNPKLTLEVNKAGSLEFDLPVGSEMYDRISKLKTTVEARQGNEILFRGRLLNTKRNTWNTITCYCEGFLSWLVDISFQPYSYNGEARDFLKYILDRYNSRALLYRKITYKYSDISAKITTEQQNYSTAWDEIKSVLVDNVGGYIVPYLTEEETGIQWLSTYGATASQVIQFGQNLIDFSEYIDASQVFTAVRAYGKDVDGVRVSLSGNNGFVQDDDAIDVYGRIERTVFFDEITTESALRKSATDYLRKGVQSALSLTLNAVDMHLLNTDVEKIRLGDSTRVVSVPHLIDSYFLCSKIMYDFAHPQNSTLTFGSTQRTISELTNPSYNKYVITEGDSSNE